MSSDSTDLASSNERELSSDQTHKTKRFDGTRQIMMPNVLLSSAEAMDSSLILNHYQILRKLGQGAMGIVYEAWDSLAEKKVALKVLQSGTLPHGDELRRFRNEAESIAKLHHPGIVRFYEVGSSEGIHYYSMDLVDGWTFDVWLTKTNPSMRQRIGTIEKVIRAVDYAHVNGVIHRDLKPGNIMVNPKNEPQVMDFGLARDVSVGSIMTMTGAILGTPSYMSPEQAEARISDIGPHSDVWSLGVILYEALTGKLPFTGRNIYEILYSILHSDPVPPHKLNPHVSRKLDRIILKCLEKQPSQRYQNGILLADDLCAWADKRPISVPAPSLIQRFFKKFKKQTRVSFEAFSVEKEARRKAESIREELERKVEKELRRQWRVVFEDDFSDPKVESRWDILGGNWELKDGRLRISEGGPQILFLKRPINGDIRIEMVCHQEGDIFGELSCFLGAIPTTPQNKSCETGYMFQYGGNWNSILQLVRGNIAVVEENLKERIEGNRVYHLKAERVGAKFSFWLDGKLLFEWIDPEPLIGIDRSLIGVYGWRADTFYHKIRISQFSAALKEDLLDVAERQLGRHHYRAALDLFQEVEIFTDDEVRRKKAQEAIKHATKVLELSERLPEIQKSLSAYGEPTIQMVGDKLSVTLKKGKLKDLSLIKDLPIAELNCSGNQISSLELLRDMPLKKLIATENQIADATPIKNCPLEELLLSGNKLTDLEFVKGMKLKILVVDENPIKDLEPLRGQKINYLGISRMPIRDLSPLCGMPITELKIAETAVSNLEPLRESKVQSIIIESTPVNNLTPLEGLPLITVRAFDVPLRSIKPFNRIPLAIFHFDDDLIPTRELEEMAEACSEKGHHTATRQNALTLIALRKKSLEMLKALAEEVDNKRYLFIPKRLTASDAQKFCKELGGSLATYSTKAERVKIRALLTRRQTRGWIGLMVKGNKVTWVDGKPYDPVMSGERWTSKKHDGLVLFEQGAFRNDLVEEIKYNFIIQWT